MRISDWSADVCSSDLQVGEISETLGTALQDFSHSHYRRCVDQLVSGYAGLHGASRQFSEGRLILELHRVGVACGLRPPPQLDRKCVLSGKRVSVCAEPGGRRILTYKKRKKNML